MPIRAEPMLRLASVCLTALLVASSVGHAATALPRPAGLEPQVRFWTRVYSEIDGDGGLIHDSRHLDVVYEAIRVPRSLSHRTRENLTQRAKKHYATILRKLARGTRKELSAEESRVLALWPDGVSNSTLRHAAGNVRFQLGQADRFREGLHRAGQWRDHIDRVLRKHGVPTELAALPHVESSYNPAAYSSVGAAGLWQFTRSTGRLFMRVDNVVDDRMDPFVASEGAARLLRSNYDELRSWPLAITAYNHGVGGMRRAVRMLGTDAIEVITTRYDGRTFGFASRNFYAEFLAALDVDRDSERFFGPITPDRPVAYEILTTDHFYPAEALERALGVDRAVLREHNLSLRPSVWNGAKYVPKGFPLRVPVSITTTPVADAIASIPAPQRFAQQHRDRLYKVQRGDTLSKIARRYHVKERELVALNNLRSAHRIRAGQVLTLPDEPGARAPVSVASAVPPTDGIYRVRRGDTLSNIASRFGVSETQLVAMNGLRNRHQIAVGQQIQVSAAALATDATESTAPVVATTEARPAEPAPVVVASVAPVEVVAVEVVEPEVVEPEAEAVEVEAFDVPGEPVDVSSAESEPNASPSAIVLAAVPPGVVLAAVPPEVPPPGSDAVVPAPDPSDYTVADDERITVQAAETLGHYAEWLEVSASRLRRLNDMRYGTPVAIGRRTRLDFSKVSREEFERRRLEYHHALQEEFFGAYEVIGTDDHLLRPGDTLWQLANVRYKIPIWLLRQYNPTLDFSALPVGTRLTIPRIAARTS